MYAVFTVVTVDESARDPNHTVLSQQIVPAVKGTPGVVGGYWLEPAGDKGTSIVLFESEQAARQAAEAMGVKVGASPAPGVVFDSVEIAEVIEHF